MSAYEEFLAAKMPRARAVGIAGIDEFPAEFFPHQRHCAEFALRQGRAGIYLDTGLGKTAIELAFGHHAALATNGQALMLVPLAVAQQAKREADRFGFDARVIREQAQARPGINICNYDRLDKLDVAKFGGVILDEASILKAYTGKTSRALIGAFAGHRFRMTATATPAPNDHMELGQQCEFLGVMPSNEMLMRWFVADQTQMGRYRLKHHGEADFWRWMASWSRMAENPADLGFDGARFVLPPLDIRYHHADATDVAPLAGSLFEIVMSATTLHDVKRQTATARAEAVASIVASTPGPAVIWCDTDYEAAAIAKAFPEAIEVRGSHPIERKEEALEAFATGAARVLLTKPSICGYGLNWQHCSTMVFAGRSFSYESWYQAVRRCWRYGQTRPVTAHVIVAEGETQIAAAIARKADDHARMKAAMAQAMRIAMADDEARLVRAYEPTHRGALPAWLQ